MSKLAIIDPVGIKAGMNCYDLGLLNALQQLGTESYAFSNFDDVRYPQVNQFPFFLEQKKGTISNITNFFSSHIKALRICRENNIDWVILHIFSTTPKDLFSFWITRLFGLKIIAIVHDVSSLSNEDNAYIRSKMYASASILVVHNQTSYKEISALLLPSELAKLRVIPHGNFIDFINTDIKQPYFQQELIYEAGKKYLLFFGQIKKVKGLDILLQAMARLPEEYKLIIAGRPHRDDFTFYDKLIDELKISNRVIKLIRFISDDERDYLFKQCDALVLPYRKIFQSGVLLLAMSYGLPVVASDLPANKEVITDGFNGYLFKDGDAADLAQKIIALFVGDMLPQLKEKTKQTAADTFGWSSIAQTYLQIIT